MHQSLSPAAPVNRLAENSSALLVTLLLVDSLHFIFARLLQPYFATEVGAFYVMGLAAVEFAIYMGYTGQLSLAVLRRHLWFFVAIGLLVGISTNMGYLAVRYIDPGVAALLGKLSTIFSIGLGLIWLRDRLTPLQGVGALLSLVGAVIIAYKPGDFLQWGAMLIVVSSLMYAVHAGLVKRYGSNIDFPNFFLYRLVCTSLVLLLVCVGRGSLTVPSLTGWGVALVVGTVDVVISRALYYLALRRLTISLHAIILTVSPAATVLWSYLLFGTKPSLQQLVGGVAVLGGVLLVTLYKAKS